MVQNKFFGVPFDPALSPERLNLKIAYVSHRMRQPDVLVAEDWTEPYETVKADAEHEGFSSEENLWLGSFPIESWLTPKPTVDDLPLLTYSRAQSFLRQNGCMDHALRISEFVSAEVHPSRIVMIGVDHSLTGGVLLALSEVYEDLNLVVFDAHFDAMKIPGTPYDSEPNEEDSVFYQCGNFLSLILEKDVVKPQNLWVLGVGEEVTCSGTPGRTELDKWLARGIHLINKKQVCSGPIELDFTGPTYVSIDMDVGSFSSVFAARFMNSHGLGIHEFLGLLSLVKASIIEKGVPLVGMDIMEIDVHLLDAARSMGFLDGTRFIARNALGILLRDDKSAVLQGNGRYVPVDQHFLV